MSGVAYWAPPEENPNFISRPPDPGFLGLMKTVGWEALYHSPFYATYRWSQLSLEKDIPTTAYPVRKLDPEELTQKYGLGGQLKFDEPMYEAAAQLMYRRKIDENDRAYLIGRGSTTGARKAASLPVGMAATLLDPINFASMFIPVVGEARIARMAQRFGGGSVLKERLVRGALTGAGGAAMVEPFILLPALQEQANYNLTDSAINLGFGAALGGMLHAGLGAIGDRLKRVKPKDADAIFEAAMNNILKDEPVTAPAKVAEFVDELSTDKVKKAAFQFPDGTVIEGSNHGQLIMRFTPEQQAVFDAGKALDGFTTEQGKFLTRDDAATLASESGQLAADADISAGLRHSDLNSSYEAQQRNALNNVPLRDEKGRFLSKEKRLAMLDQKIREELQTKQENRGQKIGVDTQENSSRLPKDDKGITGETQKDIQIIENDIAEIERALDLSPDEVTKLREDIKAEAGDQPGREKGIVEGLKCIIKNLV